MRRAFVAALFCLVAIGSARPVHAISDDFGGFQGDSCSAGTYAQAFSSSVDIYFDGFGLGQMPPAGAVLDAAVYWAPSGSSSYTLQWSAQAVHGGGAALWDVEMNISAGDILVAVSTSAAGTWTCLSGDGTAATTIQTWTNGAVIGALNDGAMASWPSTWSPTLDPNLSYFVGTSWDTPQYPPVLVFTGDGSFPENGLGQDQTITMDLSGSSDADGTIVTYSTNCDVSDQSSSFCSNQAITCDCVLLNDDGTYTGLAAVTDDDGLTTQQNFTITITNLAPTATGSCDNGTCLGTEGDTLDFTCSGTDPGWNDVPALSWIIDGVTTDGPTLGPGIGDGAPFGISNPFPDSGTFTATCQAIDDDGGADADTLQVTIANADPVLGTTTVPATANEGDTINVSTSATDLGVNDVLTYTWSWGDGTSNNTGASSSHVYVDDGSFTVEVTVGDGDGGTDSSTSTVTVANLAPTITSGTCPTTATEGTTASFSLSGSDPGVIDVLSWSLGGSSSATLSGTTGTSSGVDWTPTYSDAQAGTVTLDVTLDDGDGGTDALNCSVGVAYLDADSDGMPDTWELANGLDPTTNDAGGDPDSDGLSNLQEWQAGSDPQASGGPTAPTPSSPVAGTEVAFATPPLAFTNATDPDGDTLTYEVEIYSDSTLTALVETVTSIAEDSSGTTTTAPTAALSENTAYWWRARADDGNTTSNWSTAEDFFVNVTNDAPGLTTLTFPVASTIVTTLTPTLQWSEVTDADLDAIEYEVEVYEDAGLSTLAWSDAALAGLGNGTVEATTGTLVENAWYWWRARSVDEHGLDGGWTAAEQFLVSTVDDAPGAVTIVWPADGGQVGDLAPTIEVADGGDPEGFAIEYEIELALDAAFTGTVWSSGAIAEDGATTSWDSSTASAALVEDDPGWVRARAIDNGGLMSPWTTAQFTTNSTNNAPTVPTLIAPDGDAFALTDTIVFRFQNATDPDGTTRTYDVEVRDDIGDVAWSDTGIVEGSKESTSEVLAGDLPYGINTWTARAVDELGVTSEWATELEFEVVPPKGDDDDDDSGDDDDATGDDDDATGDDDDSTGDDDDSVSDDDDATGDDDDSGGGGGCDCESRWPAGALCPRSRCSACSVSSGGAGPEPRPESAAWRGSPPRGGSALLLRLEDLELLLEAVHQRLGRVGREDQLALALERQDVVALAVRQELVRVHGGHDERQQADVPVADAHVEHGREVGGARRVATQQGLDVHAARSGRLVGHLGLQSRDSLEGLAAHELLHALDGEVRSLLGGARDVSLEPVLVRLLAGAARDDVLDEHALAVRLRRGDEAGDLLGELLHFHLAVARAGLCVHVPRLGAAEEEPLLPVGHLGAGGGDLTGGVDVELRPEGHLHLVPHHVDAEDAVGATEVVEAEFFPLAHSSPSGSGRVRPTSKMSSSPLNTISSSGGTSSPAAAASALRRLMSTFLNWKQRSRMKRSVLSSGIRSSASLRISMVGCPFTVSTSAGAAAGGTNVSRCRPCWLVRMSMRGA